MSEKESKVDILNVAVLGLFGAGKKRDDELPAEDAMRVYASQDGNSLKISISKEQPPALKPNEQAFMLRRIQNKLS